MLAPELATWLRAFKKIKLKQSGKGLRYCNSWPFLSTGPCCSTSMFPIASLSLTACMALVLIQYVDSQCFPGIISSLGESLSCQTLFRGLSLFCLPFDLNTSQNFGDREVCSTVHLTEGISPLGNGSVCPSQSFLIMSGLNSLSPNSSCKVSAFL